MAKDCPFRAVLLDKDGTLTRNAVKGDDPFFYGLHQAHAEMLAAEDRHHDIMTREDLDRFAVGIDDKRRFFDVVAKRLNVSAVQLYDHVYRTPVDHKIVYDTASIGILNDNADRIIFFTDAPDPWYYARKEDMGHILAGQTASRHYNQADAHETKIEKGLRWVHAMRELRRRSGMHDLKFSETLMIDDTFSVLDAAQELGLQTGQCNFNYPGRAHSPSYEYNMESVGQFLVDSGFAKPVRPRRPANDVQLGRWHKTRGIWCRAAQSC